MASANWLIPATSSFSVVQVLRLALLASALPSCITIWNFEFENQGFGVALSKTRPLLVLATIRCLSSALDMQAEQGQI